jgi:hypothetical protein
MAFLGGGLLLTAAVVGPLVRVEPTLSRLSAG